MSAAPFGPQASKEMEQLLALYNAYGSRHVRQLLSIALGVSEEQMFMRLGMEQVMIWERIQFLCAPREVMLDPAEVDYYAAFLSPSGRPFAQLADARRTQRNERMRAMRDGKLFKSIRRGIAQNPLVLNRLDPDTIAAFRERLSRRVTTGRIQAVGRVGRLAPSPDQLRGWSAAYAAGIAGEPMPSGPDEEEQND